METVEISVDLRQAQGKSLARRLRKKGRVPGTFYGPKRTTLSIEVDAKELTTRVTALEGSHLIRLQSSVPELGGRVALIRELQVHPVSGILLHADFYEVDLTKKLVVKVPLHFVGKAVGVTQQGGIMQPVVREVEVECLPNDIPAYFDVDVTNLAIHDAIHLADLKAPEGVTLVYETNEAVVTVLAPMVEQVKAEAEVEAEAGAAAPEAAAPAEAGKAAAPGAKPAAPGAKPGAAPAKG